jgi:hypothetical protein
MNAARPAFSSMCDDQMASVGWSRQKCPQRERWHGIGEMMPINRLGPLTLFGHPRILLGNELMTATRSRPV